MHSNYTKNLLNLEDVLIKNVFQADSFIKIFIETKSHTQICPHCGMDTKRIHDYRTQIIKDLAKVYFPNATIVIDKYHFIRYVT